MSGSTSSRIFFDTNIIVYAYDGRDLRKNATATKLLRETVGLQQAVISSQVVQEFCHVALKKQKTSLRPEDLRMVLDEVLLPIMQHTPSAEFYNRALYLYQANSLSWYDTLIIQAAIDLNCTTLYSEDMQHGQKFGGLQIVNPFI